MASPARDRLDRIVGSTAGRTPAQVSGRMATFTESGYRAVAALRDDEEMSNFITRYLDATGKVVTSQDNLSGLVPWYSGTSAVQTFMALQEELGSKDWVVDKRTHAKPSDA